MKHTPPCNLDLSSKAFSKTDFLDRMSRTTHILYVFSKIIYQICVWVRYPFSHPNQTSLDPEPVALCPGQLSEGNVARFWSRGVNVLINTPAASPGRSRKRGDLVEERDGTWWNVMECEQWMIAMPGLPRLASTSECSLDFELHTHTKLAQYPQMCQVHWELLWLFHQNLKWGNSLTPRIWLKRTWNESPLSETKVQTADRGVASQAVTSWTVANCTQDATEIYNSILQKLSIRCSETQRQALDRAS